MNVKDKYALRVEGLTADQLVETVDRLVCGSMKTCQKCAEVGNRELCYKVSTDSATDDEKMVFVHNLMKVCPDTIYLKIAKLKGEKYGEMDNHY